MAEMTPAEIVETMFDAYQAAQTIAGDRFLEYIAPYRSGILALVIANDVSPVQATIQIARTMQHEAPGAELWLLAAAVAVMRERAAAALANRTPPLGPRLVM